MPISSTFLPTSPRTGDGSLSKEREKVGDQIGSAAATAHFFHFSGQFELVFEEVLNPRM